VSEFTAILAASKSLKALLDAAIAASTDPELPQVLVDLRSPREMRGTAQAPARGVSLWLYRVVRDADLVNRPPDRPTRDTVGRHPLPVDLHYLVTPLHDRPEGEQALLGKVLEVLNDRPVLRGSDLRLPLEAGVDELRITLETLSLEEITRTWEALEESYQLSVSYLVQVVLIDSAQGPLEVRSVDERRSTYTQIVGAGAP
jgi:hypothetical protein